MAKVMFEIVKLVFECIECFIFNFLVVVFYVYYFINISFCQFDVCYLVKYLYFVVIIYLFIVQYIDVYICVVVIKG